MLHFTTRWRKIHTDLKSGTDSKHPKARLMLTQLTDCKGEGSWGFHRACPLLWGCAYKFPRSYSH